MRNVYLLMAVILSLVGCGGGGSGSSSNGGSDVTELALKQAASGRIAKVGDVNWYHYRAVEANNILEVKCTGPMRADEELLVTVYEKDAAGNKKRLYADHAAEGSQLAANVRMNIYIDHPKDLYIAVRDLMDDEVSSGDYALSLQYVGAPDGNQNFANASALSVDDPASKLTDNIGYIGDVDCFTFSVAQDGVYGINVAFQPFTGGTSVELTVRLYDGNGMLVDEVANIQGNLYQLRSYLTGPDGSPNSGVYYVMVEDSGRDQSDTASNYQIWVESIAVSEAFANDSRNEAQTLAFDTANQRFSVNGALDYAAAVGGAGKTGDQDWYRLPASDLNPSGQLKLLKISFDDGDAANQLAYHLQVEDASGKVLLSHDFAGSSPVYENQIKAGVGDHYILVRPADNQHLDQSAPYQVSIDVIGVDDPAEENGGNDTESTAVALTSGTPETGLIAFRGDVDWYQIQVPTDSPRILELSLKSESSAVDYNLVLRLGDTQVAHQYDTNGSNGPTEIKTSIYVPAASVASATYYVKVCDYQDDDGDSVPYQIVANIEPVRTAADAFQDPKTAGGPEDTRFFAETYERAMTESESETVKVEIFSGLQPEYRANTSFLDFRGSEAELATRHITRSTAGGLTTIQFPWIAGYVDCQGDRDLFKLNLGPLDPAAPDAHWYYDVQVRLVSYPGSAVEYVWKLYRDSNGNQIVMDDPTSPDGYVACDGEDTPLSTAAVDIITPAAGDKFWVGDGWAGGDARFYFGVQDFNFLKLPASGEDNLQPDDDWGYEAPYYFQLTLVYHPGVSNPPQ